MQQEQAAGVTVQDATIEAHGLRLHYRGWEPSAGAPASLPPILLIHGLASASNIWDLTAPILAQRGFRVVALDQRGHGASDKPDHGYTFEEILADDHAVAEALHLERPIVVGHSWGGGVVLNYAAVYPHNVSAIVLVDGGFIQMGQRTGWTKEQMLKELAPPQFAGTPKDVFLTYPRRGPLAQVWSPQLEDIFLHIVELRPDDTVAPRLSLANHLQILEAMWDQQTLALYDQVTCPVLLVCPEQQATDDRSRQFQAAKREGIARILAAHPSVRVEYLADTIHDVPLQRPEALAELIAKMTAGQ
jgi:pimeloyl-ACP methyl ester carboxylesterase